MILISPRGLGLRCHGSLEVLRDPDILDLNPLHLNTPGVRGLVQARLHLLSDGLPLRQDVSEISSSKNIPESNNS